MATKSVATPARPLTRTELIVKIIGKHDLLKVIRGRLVSFGYEDRLVAALEEAYEEGRNNAKN